MRIRYILLIAAALLLQTHTATAASGNNWDCPLPLDGNLAGYATCMQNAADAAVDSAVEALENSPFMAQLPAERAMLAMARDSGINDIAQCLNQAGIQYGTVIGNAVNDPLNLVENRMAAIVTNTLQDSAGRMSGMLSRIAAGNPEALRNVNLAQVVDEIYDLMLHAAAQDPVANCALPVLNSQAALTKQVALQAYDLLQDQTEPLMRNVIQPTINSGTAVLMTAMLQEMQANASGQAATSQRPPRRTAPAPQNSRLPANNSRTPPPIRKDAGTTDLRRTTDRNVATNTTSRTVDKNARTPTTQSRTVQQSRTTTTKSSTTTKSRDDTSRRQPRTRAGETFMSNAPQMALGALQTVTGAVVTDDMERIALAEFTARTLNPAVLSQISYDLNAITNALNNGTNANGVGLEDIEELIDYVRVSNEALYSEIALATIKFYGHEVIDLTGEGLVDYAVGTLGGVEAALDNVVAAICSVASLPSGIPCSIVKGIVSFLYQQIAVPTANIFATAAVHTAWEMTVDCGADAIRAGLNPAQAQGCGETIASTLRWFPATAAQAVSFAMPYLDETQTGLRNYHTAVLNLALAAKAASNN